MPKIKPTVEDVNSRLKAAGIRLKVEQRGQKLSLVGTLPRKDGKGRKQQRISLGLNATPDGILSAEREAMKIWVELGDGTFAWPDVVQNDLGTFGHWVNVYRLEWFGKRGPLDDLALNRLWVMGQYRYLRDLPMSEVVSVGRLIEFAQTDPINTSMRHQRVSVFCRLLKLAGFDQSEIAPLRQMGGNYGASKVRKRILPTDEEIENARTLIPNPGWLLAYDLMALYGLRNHEVFHCEVDSEPPYALRVFRGKTNGRYPVLPLHRYWAEDWQPWREVELPRLNLEAGNIHLGNVLTTTFRRYGIPFKPYSLRHSYAIRATVIYRLPDTLSAKMMGHSVQMHNTIYQEWISHSQIFDIYKDVTGG